MKISRDDLKKYEGNKSKGQKGGRNTGKVPQQKLNASSAQGHGGGHKTTGRKSGTR